MGTKVEEEDPTDLLPKVAAEKMTRRPLHSGLRASKNKFFVSDF